MPDHVAQQCLDELQSRLEWLESAQTGYTTVLVDVVQPVPLDEDADFGTHLYCELFPLNPERDETLDSAGNPPIIGWAQEMYAQITLKPSESSTTSINAMVNEIIKDVTRAMFQDPTAPGVYEHKLGGIANGMDILAPEIIDASEEGFDILVVGVRVRYQTRENDPSTQA